MEKIRIVADSAADIKQLDGFPFSVASLKIITAEHEYVDDATLDVEQMVENLQKYKGRSSTACPSSGDWLAAFGDAEQVFCVTITGTLSGSYNAARIAKEQYEESYPGRRGFVLNSLSAGPEIRLMLEKLKELAQMTFSFEEIGRQIKEYTQRTGLLFMLESMKNLANNGRVSPLVAKMAGLLGIRVVGKASDKGDLEPLVKSRGQVKALESIVDLMKKQCYTGGKVRIAHCQNERAGLDLKSRILEEFPRAQVLIDRCGGLCSFYAEKGGLLVGFEKA